MKKYEKLLYKICKCIYKVLLKILYRPKVYGKENIPKEGSLILAGNHVMAVDPTLVMSSTNRIVHYMAKEELFKGFHGWLFKKIGLIKIDREKSNVAAILKAEEILKEGGTIGIFPEGTRNHLKMSKIKELYDEVNCGLSEEEFSQILIEQQPLLSQINILRQLYLDGEISQKEYMDAIINVDSYLKNNFSENFYYDSLLLPFKFGAVSMAQKSNATIVPFAVTGDYKIGNDNLVVNYGEGFKISDRSLEEANTELRKNVLALLKQNKKM